MLSSFNSCSHFQLLEKDPARRLGVSGCPAGDVCEQPFFKNIDFKALRKQQLAAPWVPDLKNPLDSSKFNEVDKNVTDKMTANDPPNTAPQQAMFTAFGKMRK